MALYHFHADIVTRSAGSSVVASAAYRAGEQLHSEYYFDCITDAARRYAKTIFDALRRYEYNPDLMQLYVVGGGGCVLQYFGEYDRERVTIIEDICATAKGYEYLAYMALRKERAT